MGFYQPEQRDIAAETADTLNARLQLAPQIRAQVPAETQTQLDAFNQMLYGSNGTPGYLAQYQAIAPVLQGLDAQGNRTQRASDLADLQTYGPQMTQAFLDANPWTRDLLGQLNTQATAENADPYALTPTQQRLATQSSRGAMAARGLGGSNLGAADEVFQNYLASNKEADRRRAFAQTVLGLNKAITADPAQLVLQRPGNTVNQTLGAAGQTGGAGQSTVASVNSNFDPFNAYAGNLNSGNQAASQGLGAGLLGGLFSLGGQLGGAYIGGRKV